MATDHTPTNEQLLEALRRLLPYAEVEASKQPTTNGRVQRMLQARKDRDFARSLLSA